MKRLTRKLKTGAARLAGKAGSQCRIWMAEMSRRPVAYGGLAVVYGAAVAGLVDKAVAEQALCAIYAALWLRG